LCAAIVQVPDPHVERWPPGMAPPRPADPPKELAEASMKPAVALSAAVSAATRPPSVEPASAAESEIPQAIPVAPAIPQAKPVPAAIVKPVESEPPTAVPLDVPRAIIKDDDLAD
jgi:hypothetical protein